MADINIDVDSLENIVQIFLNVVVLIINVLLNPLNPDSVIMVFFNLLPIVGTNAIDTEVFIYILASSGFFILMFRVLD